MTVFNDHFSARADEYRQFRPDYPPELFDWLAARVKPHGKVWDAATGNGQAAVRLAGVFDEVIATDASERQIAHAIPHDRVHYRVASSETSGLPDASVDCVTVAAAIHWFDVPKFYEEVRRVTRAHALLAVWSYDRVHVSPEIDDLTWKLYRDITGPYWPKGREHVEARYETIPFPFEEISVPGFDIRRSMDVDMFLGYLRTWSSVHRYAEANGRDPVIEVEEDLRRLWTGERLARWPIFMRAGYVHKSQRTNP